MFDYQTKRAIKLINQAIETLKLNLDGQIVLTEVGSNYYIYTPIIAALAGAKKVCAVTKDSRYGKGEDIKNECLRIAAALGVANKIEISINVVPDEFVSEANIITNSGNLRPLNESILSKAKKNVVVPLMYEKWEVRKEDIDIDYCQKNKIKVAGTWEEHPDINVFGACGQLAIKLAHEAGYEVFGNNIVVWSNDHFGDVISEGFRSAGAKKVVTTTNYSDLLKNFKECDFIFVCDYDETRSYFGNNGFMDLNEFTAINDAFGVVHLYGDIDNQLLSNNGVNVYPMRKGVAKFMTQTLGYVGLTPIINLQVAGLKVAECMIKNEKSELVQYF